MFVPVIKKLQNTSKITEGIDCLLLVSAAPKYSPSRIVQMIKSISAKALFKRFPELKKELWGGEFWGDGGYIGTVGEGVNADIIRNYIKKQGRNPDQLKLSDF